MNDPRCPQCLLKGREIDETITHFVHRCMGLLRMRCLNATKGALNKLVQMYQPFDIEVAAWRCLLGSPSEEALGDVEWNEGSVSSSDRRKFQKRVNRMVIFGGKKEIRDLFLFYLFVEHQIDEKKKRN
jgi:hypothetical protein